MTQTGSTPVPMPRLGAVLSPVSDAATVVEAALAAEAAGLEAVGLWDHYHSAQPDRAYVAGWSAYGAIAAATTSVRLVPMVLNSLHYELGVLAKESSILALLSGGRFELGIGAGDWPASFAAWGRAFPTRDERLGRLEENIEALRALWTGEPVTRAGSHVDLDGACSTPVPPVAPRVVVGVGGSPATLARAVQFADELNVYDDLLPAAVEAVARSGRSIAISSFVSWQWDRWPEDPGAELARLRERGAERVFVSLGAADMPARITQLAGSVQAARDPAGSRPSGRRPRR